METGADVPQSFEPAVRNMHRRRIYPPAAGIRQQKSMVLYEYNT